MERNARTADVAAAAGLAPATIQSYARKGAVPVRVTPGGQYRYNVEEVLGVLGITPVAPRGDLRSVFDGPGVLVSTASAYRPDPIDATAQARLRRRRVAPRAASRQALTPTDGAAQLAEVIAASGERFALAVLASA